MPDSTILPALYHAHHISYNEDLLFWLELAAQNGKQALELGCGTGRVLLPLAQSGIAITGIDNDPDMLAFLRQSLPEGLQPAPRIEAADMTAFDLGQRFPLVISPCNTWSTLSAEARGRRPGLHRPPPAAGRRLRLQRARPAPAARSAGALRPESRGGFPLLAQRRDAAGEQRLAARQEAFHRHLAV